MEFCLAHEASGSVDRIEHGARRTLFLCWIDKRVCGTPNRCVVLVLIRALVTYRVVATALPGDIFLNLGLVNLSHEADRQFLNLAQVALPSKHGIVSLYLWQDSDDFAGGESVDRANEALLRPDQVRRKVCVGLREIDAILHRILAHVGQLQHVKEVCRVSQRLPCPTIERISTRGCIILSVSAFNGVSYGLSRRILWSWGRLGFLFRFLIIVVLLHMIEDRLLNEVLKCLDFL